MKVEYKDLEHLPVGTKIKVLDGVSKDKMYLRLEEYSNATYGCWADLSNGSIWHYSRLIGHNEKVEILLLPKILEIYPCVTNTSYSL